MFDKKGKETEKSQSPRSQDGPTAGNKELSILMGEAEAAEAGPLGGAGSPPPVKTDPRLLSNIWRMMFSTVAARMGAHWKLSDEEAAQLGELTVPIVDKYVPKVLDKYGAELVLGWSLVNIISARMVVGREKTGTDNGNPRTEGERQVNVA